MRVLLFGNNRMAADIASILRENGDEIVGAVLHPPARRRFGPEILAAAKLSPGVELDADRLSKPEVLAQIDALRPEIGVSILFGYILRKDVLGRLPGGCVNLHPGYLPYNRGAYPNVWSIIEGTPAGVALHWINEGVDTGDLIARERVAVSPSDTGESLYRRLETAGVSLFRSTWPLVRRGTAPRMPQGGPGTVHRVNAVEAIDEIDRNRMYRAGDLLDVLRARTFPPYNGAYFRDRGRKIFIEVRLRPEDQVAKVPESEPES